MKPSINADAQAVADVRIGPRVVRETKQRRTVHFAGR